MLLRRILPFLLFVSITAVPQQDVEAGDRFVDVPDDSIFYDDIEWLATEGITRGCNPPTNDRFCPKSNVTREQMAAFLVRALGLTDNGGGNSFVDDDGSIFEDDIAKLAAAGITRGCNPPTNDRFCPKSNVTREQMAAFLHRAMATKAGPVIAAISPSSGKPGTQVTVTGSGFDSVPEDQLRISFRHAIGSADIVSLSGTSLEVVVPAGAVSGPIEVASPLGSAVSPTDFTVLPTISITPETHEMLRSEQLSLACTLSGVAPPTIQWSIAAGDGSVTGDGTFTAPADIPATNPVLVRCSSVADPTLYAEAEVTILPPTALPGEATILPGVGGEVSTVQGEVTIDIPPGALSQETLLTLDVVADADLPSLPDDAAYVASLELGPPGVTFDEPVDVTMTLRHWMEPGTVLDTFEPDGDRLQVLIPGPAMTVDASGTAIVGEIEHAGTLLVDADLAMTKEDAAKRLRDLIAGNFEFQITRPRNTEMLEGLTVPILVSRSEGPGTGMGPFYEGAEVSAVLSGVPADESPLTVGPVVQPNATGWALGTFIHIPVLPDCDEGEQRTAYLTIGYTPAAGTPESMSIPFNFSCLDELIVTGGSPPDPLPIGGYWDASAETLLLAQGTHRFSTIDVRDGATIAVGEYTSFVGPLRLEVTSDLTVGTEGTINLKMEDGGFGHYHGFGGDGGAWHGGDGGACGDCVGDNRDGSPGEDAAYGGAGGNGGADWDYTSPIDVFFGIVFLVVDVATGAWVSVVLDVYDLGTTVVAIASNDDEQYVGGGFGGKAPKKAQVSVTDPPQAGGGGGGSGEADISWLPDDEGSGGGGGGGGAHPLDLAVGGNVIIERWEWVNGELIPSGLITGLGGNGGLGGGGFFDDNAPGGGGGGGNGAYVRIAAEYIYNSGVMEARGGYPGLSQICPSEWGVGQIGLLDGEYCGGEVLLPIKGIGEMGHNGVFDLRARLRGQWPRDARVKLSDPSDSWRQKHNFAFTGLGDADGDGLKDGLEDYIGTDKFLADTDVDGLTDYEEVVEYGTDPNDFDTDGDGLSDGSEVAANPYVTDPLQADTDGDGYDDPTEITKGSDPTNPASTPEICDGIDNDLDGLVDEECELRDDHQGTEFYIPFLPNISDGTTPDLRLIITSEGTSEVTVEYPVGSIITTVTVTPDASQEVAIPSTAATGWPAFSSANPTLDMNVVRVQATYDVAVVAENRTVFSSDRALALPNSALGQEYFTTTWLPGNGDAQFAVVAIEDGAGFTFDLPGPVDPISFSGLEAGEGLLVNAGADLAGVRVVATSGKVVVANGNNCANVGGSYCEHLYEIALPTSRWGTEYFARSNRSEELQSGRGLERNYYRIVVGEDDSRLFVNSTLIATGLAAGAVVDIEPEDPYYGFDTRVTSDNRIHVTQFMSSICDEWPDDPTCTTDPYGQVEVFGDASMSNVIPADSYPMKYRFNDMGCSAYPWDVALNIIAPTTDATSEEILVDGTAVPSSAFTQFAFRPEWSVATVSVIPSWSPPTCYPMHTSSSPNGHGVHFIWTGHHTAMTHPLGYDFEP